MSIKHIKGSCSQCSTEFLYPVSEIRLHMLNENEILCWKCCKEHNWKSKKCSRCSEKTMCKGMFKPNILNAIKKERGI